MAGFLLACIKLKIITGGSWCCDITHLTDAYTPRRTNQCMFRIAADEGGGDGWVSDIALHDWYL